MSNPIRKIELIEGGTIIKQGEIFTLGFRLFSGQGELIVPEPDQIITIKIANKEGVIFTTTAVTMDDHIEFTVEGNLGYGNMRLEIKVTDGVDTLQKFPSDGWIDLLITPSLDDIGVGGIDKVTADEMFADIAVINGIAADALDVSITAEDNSLIAVGIANAADVKSTTALSASTSAEASASAAVIKSEESELTSNEALSQAAAANTKSDTAIVTSELAETKAAEAKARADLIIGQAGSSNTEIVDSRLGADLVARATSGTLIREIHTQQLENARQTTTLSNGVSAVSGGVDALADVEIEGRTLISLANSNLEASKQYVVADKKTKVIVDGVTQSGVAKFTKGTTTVSTANYLNKVAGSTVANPHNAKFTVSQTILSAPTGTWNDFSDAGYDLIESLNGQNYPKATITTSGAYAQQLFSFDIIAEIERKLGVIPKSTVAEKVQWVKDNVESLVANWHGFGSSVGGNKASLRRWDVTSGAWAGVANTTSSAIAKVTTSFDASAGATGRIIDAIDTNGFMHLLAFADASDGVTASSISTDYIDLIVTLKSTAQLNTRPTIIRVENFEGKVSGSVVENAHVAKRSGSASLLIPSAFNTEFDATRYTNSMKLDGSLLSSMITSVSGEIAQKLFSFNLIEAIERNIGKIPRTSIADKVQWIKDNVAKLNANWHGFGSSVGGNKASFQRWISASIQWFGSSVSLASTVAKLANTSDASLIDANGFVHYLAFAEPSNGTTASTINTDYIDLEIELKPTADFTRPKVALYEVTADSYAKILVDWSADEVVNRYPSVEGVQHLQGVGVIAEGENLLPPFTEWTLHANAKVVSSYELELNATTNGQYSTYDAKLLANVTYVLSGGGSGQYYRSVTDLNGANLVGTQAITLPFTYTPTQNVILNIKCASAGAGIFRFTAPMLTLGTIAKPFVPRNPSYLYADVKLGAIGTVADRLYEQDGAKFVRKVIEKDVVLGGDLAWTQYTDFTGFKKFGVLSVIPLAKGDIGIVSKYNGSFNAVIVDAIPSSSGDQHRINVGNFHTSVKDEETGFGETYQPLVAEIKAYFYGYKINNGTYGTPYDGTGTKTWIPISDTTNARAVTVVPTSASPTQLDGTIQPYKLSYVLATPQIVNVTDKVEGQLKVNGLTQVEVLSGIVRREKATPQLDGAVYWIWGKQQISYWNTSKVKNNVSKMLRVYKNGNVDNSWIIQSEIGFKIGQALYDPTAEYTVTYIAEKPLLTANPTNIKLLYANNMRSSLEDTVGKVQDNTTQLSVHEKAIIDLYVRVKALGG